MYYEINYKGERLIIARNPPTARMKRIRLNIHPDTRITISAPKHTNCKLIQRFIDTHVDWIYQQYHRVKQLYNPPPQYSYSHGELHWFVGKLYPLAIAAQQSVLSKIDNDKIELNVKEPGNPDKVKQALLQWYKKEALLYFSQRVQSICSLTPWVTEVPLIKCRKMKRQWGNCSQSGHITLNTHLIKAPAICIDYVILHELCHLQEFNHSAKFYALMNKVMPNWRQHKEQLSRLATQLIVY